MTLSKVIVLSSVLLMTACSQQEFYIHGNSTQAPTKNTMQSFFISGLGQTKSMDAAKVCGSADKVVKVQTQRTFGEYLLGMITIGIYTPRSARVYCSN